MNFTVIYRMGGTEVWEWRACRPVATMQEAVSQKDSITRGGRKAIIRLASQHVRLGLPQNYSPNVVLTTAMGA